MTYLLLQTTSAPNGTSESMAWAAIFLYTVIIAVTAVVVLHGSGMLMRASRQEYWFGVALGFLFLYFGLLASLIYFLIYKFSHRERFPQWQPDRPPEPAYYDETNILLQPQLALPQAAQPMARCAQCGSVNAPGTDFCMVCGERLGGAARSKSCPDCHTELPVEAAFCHQCGNSFA